MFLWTLQIQFGFFCLSVLTAFEHVDYWRKRANKTEVFGYKETLSNKYCCTQKTLIYSLSKWMSSECNNMKIIKGKGLILSLFLSCVTLLLGWLLVNDFVCWPMFSNNRKGCFRCKAFFKSDSVVGFTRSSSLNPCKNMLCFLNFYQYFRIWIWCYAISLDVGQVGR